MNFERGTIRGSPYVGIFSTITDDIAVVPHPITSKEMKNIEKTLEVTPIKASLGDTSLIGILSKGIGKKIVVSNISEKREIKKLEKEGLEVLQIDGFTSTGNLIAMNKNGGIASPLVQEKNIKKLGAFFKIKFKQMRIAESDLPGACLTVTNKGFIAHPNISEEDFERAKKIFKTEGKATTANYGDLFTGNSVVANSKGVITGILTSGIEL